MKADEALAFLSDIGRASARPSAAEKKPTDKVVAFEKALDKQLALTAEYIQHGFPTTKSTSRWVNQMGDGSYSVRFGNPAIEVAPGKKYFSADDLLAVRTVLEAGKALLTNEDFREKVRTNKRGTKTVVAPLPEKKPRGRRKRVV